MQGPGKKGLDEDAAMLLYRRYAPSLLAYLYKRTSSWEDAEDVLVDIFLAALEKEHFLTLCEHEQRS